jgi:hypothetical protein
MSFFSLFRDRFAATISLGLPQRPYDDFPEFGMALQIPFIVLPYACWAYACGFRKKARAFFGLQ